MLKIIGTPTLNPSGDLEDSNEFSFSFNLAIRLNGLLK